MNTIFYGKLDDFVNNFWVHLIIEWKITAETCCVKHFRFSIDGPIYLTDFNIYIISISEQYISKYGLSISSSIKCLASFIILESSSEAKLSMVTCRENQYILCIIIRWNEKCQLILPSAWHANNDIYKHICTYNMTCFIVDLSCSLWTDVRVFVLLARHWHDDRRGSPDVLRHTRRSYCRSRLRRGKYSGSRNKSRLISHIYITNNIPWRLLRANEMYDGSSNLIGLLRIILFCLIWSLAK